MARFVYTPEMIEFVRQGYKRVGLRDLVGEFNNRFGMQVSHGQLRAMTKNHKIRCGRKPGAINKGQRGLLTPEQDAWLREAYKSTPLADLPVALKKEFDLSLKPGQVRSYLHNHKITSGRSGRFEKGQDSWNKGKKGYMGANATSFKRGHKPHNTKHLWHERVSKDGYVEMQVPERNPHTGYPNRYKLKHRWLWEQHHGAVPDGYMVTFRNGDRTDIRLENLELLSRAENAIRNKMQYSALPEEIKPTAALLAKVYDKKNQRKKERATP